VWARPGAAGAGMAEAAERTWGGVGGDRAEAEVREREAWIRGQREALEAALNGAPLATSLGALVRTAADGLGQGTRAAFYLADDQGASLHHVVGMPAAYAEAGGGLKVRPVAL